MSISLDMLKRIKGGMQMLRLYLYIKKEYSGKVKWDEHREDIANALGVSASNLRNIKARAIKLGILETGGKTWVFVVGNKKWIVNNDVCTSRIVHIPEFVFNDSKQLRTYINCIFISNVIREYGKADKKGRASMSCSISYLESALNWSRYRVLKARKEGHALGFILVEKNWDIFASTRFGLSEKEVKKIFTDLKKSMAVVSGEDFKTAKIAILFKDKKYCEVLIPSSSIITTSIKTGRR